MISPTDGTKCFQTVSIFLRCVRLSLSTFVCHRYIVFTIDIRTALFFYQISSIIIFRNRLLLQIFSPQICLNARNRIIFVFYKTGPLWAFRPIMDARASSASACGRPPCMGGLQRSIVADPRGNCSRQNVT